MNQAPLTVTGLTAGDKVYDGTTAASLSGTAAISGTTYDVLALVGTAAGVFADDNVGSNIGVTVSGLTLSGTGASNYTLTQQGGLTASITPAPLTVAGLIAGDKVYDGTTAASLSGTAAISGSTYDVLTLVGTAAGVFADDNVGSNIGVTVSGLTLSGTGASNYALTQQNGLTASITQRAIVAIADAQTKQAGETDPALTFVVGGLGLVSGDSLSGALGRALGETAGVYAINQGTLTASANYILSYVGADLTITEAPVETSANTDNTYDPTLYQARIDGDAPPVLNVSFQFSSNTNAPTIGVVTNTTVSSNAPAQTIAPSGGQAELFPPISQFDPAQYTGGTLPDFAPHAGEAAVLAMIARAAENNQQAPAIDKLVNDNVTGWSNLSGPVANHATFGDGNGNNRVPAGGNGFAFSNGTTDVAALLLNGPVMLSGAQPADPAQPKLWLLALSLTDDGKGIVANDPMTGKRVVLSYDPVAKTVGGVVGTVDPESGGLIMLDESLNELGVNGQPAAAVDLLKAFVPTSYFAVSL
ncbi:MAG: hypothetical protein K9G60_07540 [Pseudolabrys sp.]|nr:hypothetical protein [Pseudolabrys sp.]